MSLRPVATKKRKIYNSDHILPLSIKINSKSGALFVGNKSTESLELGTPQRFFIF
jgi:hypothetical protein